MTPQSSLLRLPNGLYSLSIKGSFTHPHWMAFLFAGLAGASVSVVSGRAIQSDIGWDAQINLDFSRSTGTPESLDYVAMALQKPASADVGAPQLLKFHIIRRADSSLEVTLEGADQIGFLGRVLGRLSLLMLFPTEIEISTVSGLVRDRLVLRGIGGAPPTAMAQSSLETLLRALVRSR